jgi:hypothetical protein
MLTLHVLLLLTTTATAGLVARSGSQRQQQAPPASAPAPAVASHAAEVAAKMLTDGQSEVANAVAPEAEVVMAGQTVKGAASSTVSTGKEVRESSALEANLASGMAGTAGITTRVATGCVQAAAGASQVRAQMIMCVL